MHRRPPLEIGKGTQFSGPTAPDTRSVSKHFPLKIAELS
jgi:hypothetical protein